MKIIVNKHEYAELVQTCAKNRNSLSMCSICLLAKLCKGRKFMESMCEVVEDKQ